MSWLIDAEGRIYAIITLDNGWWPVWHQANTWTISSLLTIGPGGHILGKFGCPGNSQISVDRHTMMTSRHGNTFRTSEPLWRESTGHHHVDSPHDSPYRGSVIRSIDDAMEVDDGFEQSVKCKTDDKLMIEVMNSHIWVTPLVFTMVQTYTTDINFPQNQYWVQSSCINQTNKQAKHNQLCTVPKNCYGQDSLTIHFNRIWWLQKFSSPWSRCMYPRESRIYIYVITWRPVIVFSYRLVV